METEYLNIGEWKYSEAEKERGNRPEFDSNIFLSVFTTKEVK